LFSAYSEGGHGKASFENRFNASYSARIIGNSGLSDMTPTEFRNLSFGKFSSVSPSLSEDKERIEGSFVTKDAEFFFQNLYATFLFPRKDNAVFEKFISAQKQNIVNRKLQPNAAFYDTLYALKTNFHPRAKSITLADVDQLNLDKMFDFYKERFQNGGDFTYFFVGNTDLIPNFEDYLNTYIGSLSAQKNKDKSVSFDYKTPEGKYEIIKSDATDPQNKVEILLSGKQKYNRKNRQQIEMLATIVEGRLLIELREEKSAVYGVSCDGNVGSDNRYSITVNFGCEPGKEQELIAATYSIFEKIKAEGATTEEVQKIIENRKKTTEENRKSNNSLLSTIVYARQRNLNLDFFKTPDTANKHYYEMKPQDFSTLAKKYLNRKNEILSILKTKKKDGS
jgi:zinc protease